MLPTGLVGLRPLSDDEIRTQSFGQVKVAGAAPQGDWKALRDTLCDPRIFGPPRSWRCACGKIELQPSAGKSICDVCGCAVQDARRMRRRRYGHIQLFREVPHPLFPAARISVVPVLPIAYRQPQRYTAGLNEFYSNVIAANDAQNDEVITTVAQLYCNEWLDSPRRPKTKPFFSVLMCLSLISESPRGRTGGFLAGLGLGIEVRRDPAVWL